MPNIYSYFGIIFKFYSNDHEPFHTQNMKYYRLYALLALLLMASTASAYDFETVCSTGQTLYYNINPDSISVTVTYPEYDSACNNYYYGYNMPTGIPIIPETVSYQNNAYTVTAIGDHAFYNCDGLNTVILPQTVTSIGDYAFYLATLNGHFVIPDQVTFIGAMAFGSVHNMNEVTIGASVDSLGPGAFSGRDIRTVHYNAINCKDLAVGILHEQGIVETITIGENVTRIPALIFSSSTVNNTLVIPNSVTCIAHEAFLDCQHIPSVIIGDGVTEIGAYAFALSYNLTNLTLGQSLKTVDDCAFLDCQIRGHLVLPDSLEYIGEMAFSGGEFDTLTIGSSVNFIDFDAFGLNRFLRQIYAKPTQPPYLGYQYLFYQQNQIPVEVPCGSLSAYLSDPNWAIFHNIIADFPYHLTVESSDLQMGSVSILEEPNCAQEAVIKATPEQGFEFDRWEADGVSVSQDETYIFQLEQDMTLVAYFKVYDEIEEDYNNNSIVHVYPNPTRDRVTINGVEASEVLVSNALGQLVKTVRGTNELDVSTLTDGLYYLRIYTTDGLILSRKIIVE